MVGCDVNVLITRLGGVLAANLVGHSLGEERHSVESDAIFGQTVARDVVVSKRRIDGINRSIDDVIHDGQRVIAQHPATHLSGIAASLVACALATVVANGETIEAHTVAHRRFVNLYEATLAHRGVILVNGHSVLVRRATIVASLVLVVNQFVGCHAERQDVVREPLIEHVGGRRVVVVGHKVVFVGILMIVHNPLHELLQRIGRRRVDALRTPELVFLGEECETVLAVLGHTSRCATIGAVLLVREPSAVHSQEVVQVFDFATLIEVFVHLVAYLLERIHQTAGLQRAAEEQDALLLCLYNLLEIRGGIDVVGCNDLVNLIQHTVEHKDVAIPLVYLALPIDVVVVELRLGPVNRKLTVVEVGQRELAVVLGGEETQHIALRVLILAIDDAVAHNDGPDGVELRAVGESFEGVPRRISYDLLLHQRLQILVDSLVRGHETSEVSTRREQLINRRSTQSADGHLLEHVQVLGIHIAVILEVGDDCALPEDVSRRGVHLFLAAGEQQQEANARKKDSFHDVFNVTM